jgi:hypothetical protein
MMVLYQLIFSLQMIVTKRMGPPVRMALAWTASAIATTDMEDATVKFQVKISSSLVSFYGHVNRHNLF